LLSEHHDQLTKLANALMEHEQLDRPQFEALLQPERGSSEDSSCLPSSASK
jgi:ATP-dependent Zn protease